MYYVPSTNLFLNRILIILSEILQNCFCETLKKYADDIFHDKDHFVGHSVI